MEVVRVSGLSGYHGTRRVSRITRRLRVPGYGYPGTGTRTGVRVGYPGTRTRVPGYGYPSIRIPVPRVPYPGTGGIRIQVPG